MLEITKIRLDKENVIELLKVKNFKYAEEKNKYSSYFRRKKTPSSKGIRRYKGRPKH